MGGSYKKVRRERLLDSAGQREFKVESAAARVSSRSEKLSRSVLAMTTLPLIVLCVGTVVPVPRFADATKQRYHDNLTAHQRKREMRDATGAPLQTVVDRCAMQMWVRPSERTTLSSRRHRKKFDGRTH